MIRVEVAKEVAPNGDAILVFKTDKHEARVFVSQEGDDLESMKMLKHRIDITLNSLIRRMEHD